MKNSWLDKTEYEGIGTKSKCSYLTYIDFKIKSVTFLIYTKILFTPSNWEVLPNNWEFIISSLLIIYYSYLTDFLSTLSINHGQN